MYISSKKELKVEIIEPLTLSFQWNEISGGWGARSQIVGSDYCKAGLLVTPLRLTDGSNGRKTPVAVWLYLSL
jgi:hypothetical protein